MYAIGTYSYKFVIYKINTNSMIDLKFNYITKGTCYEKVVKKPGVLPLGCGAFTRRPMEKAGAWSYTARTALMGS